MATARDARGCPAIETRTRVAFRVPLWVLGAHLGGTSERRRRQRRPRSRVMSNWGRADCGFGPIFERAFGLTPGAVNGLPALAALQRTGSISSAIVGGLTRQPGAKEGRPHARLAILWPPPTANGLRVSTVRVDGSAPLVWRAASGAASITSKPTSGPQSSLTTSPSLPGSYRLNSRLPPRPHQSADSRIDITF